MIARVRMESERERRERKLRRKREREGKTNLAALIKCHPNVTRTIPIK